MFPKITLAMIVVFILGYVFARFVPQVGKIVGLP